MHRKYLMFCTAVALATLMSAALVRATESATDADKIFTAKVSQGGKYEVEASKLAEKRATSADVKDVAATEVHDHEGVNEGLKKVAAAAGIDIATDLNDEFKARLEKLNNTPAADFDAAYIEDMKQIHDKDEKLFAKEAEEGSESFKAFAHETDRIVKRHIGSLHGVD